MKVLGIDPGLANTGWSIVELAQGCKFKICDVGIIKTDKKDDFSSRLSLITNSLVSIAEANNIKHASAEDIFFTKNISSAIEVAKVIGSFSYALKQKGVELYFYTPTRIKQMITGGGKADKKAIQKMVDVQLVDKSFRVKTDHEYDSVAAAMTFFFELKSAMLENSGK